MYQIMLVEDEALVRESMAQNTNWEKFGFAPPHVFENGRQAADHLETVLPDVVITDICMPFLDGLELARHIYETLPETIVATATTMENTMMTGPIQPITSSSLLNPNAKATKISTAISRLPT